MKIIQPPHKKTARKVESLSQIKDFIEPMRAFTNSDNFPGRWQIAMAISHAQVSDDPYSFFIVHKNQAKLFGGEDVIINAKIIEEGIGYRFDEACMSFPFRSTKSMERAYKIKVEYYVPRKIMGGLRKVVGDFQGTEAVIFQHEIDHAHGKNIFNK